MKQSTALKNPDLTYCIEILSPGCHPGSGGDIDGNPWNPYLLRVACSVCGRAGHIRVLRDSELLLVPSYYRVTVAGKMASMTGVINTAVAADNRSYPAVNWTTMN